jgi:oligosaccharide repeat unit polymerase
VAVAACAPVILGGTRFLVLYIVLPLILVLLGRSRKRAAGINVAKVILVAVLCAVTFQAMLYFRSRGVTSLRNISVTDIGEAKTNFQFDALLLSRYLVPDTYDFIHESMAPFFVIHWIPRSLWPEKPVPEVLTLFNVGNGVTMSTGNITPSVIGQYYMCWGVSGIIGIALIIGGITRFADRLVLCGGMQLSMPFVVALGSLYASISCSFRYFSPFYFSHAFMAFVCAYILTTKAARCDAGAKAARIGVHKGLMQ